MNLDQIKIKSSLEDISELVFKYINIIQEKRKLYPEGIDIEIPSYLISEVEIVCDRNDIPCHVASNNYITTAKTYTQLLAFENKR
jgi:hypothetical protein